MHSNISFHFYKLETHSLIPEDVVKLEMYRGWWQAVMERKRAWYERFDYAQIIPRMSQSKDVFMAAHWLWVVQR